MTGANDYKTRTATAADQAHLATFECADPARPYTAEVEHFIQNDLWEWATAPGARADDPRLLIVVEDAAGEIAAVGAHEFRNAQASDGQPCRIRWIEVVAVATSHQGRRTPSQVSYGDVALSGVIADINARSDDGIAVFAKVHRNNSRSLAMLSRHNFNQAQPVLGTPYLHVS